MPAAVKAYFDCVLMKGETFEETEHGTIGLLRDKSAAVLSVAGGLLSNSSRDHSFPLARSLLEYMGMKRIESVLAEGLDVRPEHREDIVSRMCIHSRALGASLRSELPLQR
jgi:FMN-dependent NADH-azoreductase